MSSNYPPGVTGNEYAIAGPDYERESTIICDNCGHQMTELGYRGERWLSCDCGNSDDLPPIETDPDRAYDEARERRLFGEDA